MNPKIKLPDVPEITKIKNENENLRSEMRQPIKLLEGTVIPELENLQKSIEYARG